MQLECSARAQVRGRPTHVCAVSADQTLVIVLINRGFRPAHPRPDLVVPSAIAPIGMWL